jgi:hypothetical protein
MTENEIKESADLFAKHNVAINMDAIPDVKGWWFHGGWKYRFWEWVSEHNPFSVYLLVSSADEYINMPWSKRSVWWFWYKDALLHGDGKSARTIFGRKEDRDKIENFIKANHYIQYHLRNKGFRLKCKLSCFYDWCDNVVFPRQKWLTKQIPRSWSDKTHLIPLLNFALVVDFIEGEKALEVVNYEDGSEHHSQFAKGLKDCYNYIKVRRPKIEEYLSNSYPDEEKMTGDYYVDYAEHNLLELLLNNEDTKYLTWIVVNRDYLWT